MAKASVKRASFSLEDEYQELFKEISKRTRRNMTDELRMMIDARAAALGLTPIGEVDPQFFASPEHAGSLYNKAYIERWLRYAQSALQEKMRDAAGKLDAVEVHRLQRAQALLNAAGKEAIESGDVAPLFGLLGTLDISNTWVGAKILSEALARSYADMETSSE